MSKEMTMNIFLYTSFFICLFRFSVALDTISPSESISDDGKNLVSKHGNFELGFFSPSASASSRYLGIWYKKIQVQTVVWVANRRNPINDSSGLLMINSNGDLVILSNNTKRVIVVVWSSNSTNSTSSIAQSPLLQLLDTGNLVLRDEKDVNSVKHLWQSFDYPCDTLLPGMKLGWDLRTGFSRNLTSWRNAEDPSPGDLMGEIVLQENPELVIWKGSKKLYRTGPWNGRGFSGAPELRVNPLFEYFFVSNEEELYYMYKLKDESMISRIVLNGTTNARERYTWIESDQTWRLYQFVPKDYCDDYGLCGSYGSCIITQSPICQCLDGFKPKIPNKWNSMDWAQGCVRNKPLNCEFKEAFVKFVGLKMPDATHSSVNKTMDLKECRAKCLENCSCMAYTSSNFSGVASGCTMWFNDLIDIRQFAAGGQDLYVRMSASEIGTKVHRKTKITVVIVAAVVILAGLVGIGYYIRRIMMNFEEKTTKSPHNDSTNTNQNEEDLELPLFDLATIVMATNNFSMENKLGEGGFGPVYKGTLLDGHDIAVKRLSKSSGQGLNEFKNEVKLIAKLQHRNLVKLLGCCIQAEEKMLVYEYMPNRSLDSFIFDRTRGKQLDWTKRFNIICSIARGILYLHQDSRLRIIHRDLKASNVLLDDEMNPKISDFGMAKLFGGDQTEGSTNRVVGTYGYMAPEYAIDGIFSVKSDVFSFGILLLEIVSGLKNRGYYHRDHSHNLIGHAWRLWKEGKPLELVDELIGEDSEMIRCIHISLLCVQQNTEDRPTMSSVVLMLMGSETELPPPKQPGFLLEKNTFGSDSLVSSKHEFSSTNEITVTLLEAR